MRQPDFASVRGMFPLSEKILPQDKAALYDELALAGAVLIIVSDSSLAVRKFPGPYAQAQTLILSTYWLSIALIGLSATA